ncbi:hypothetical protein ACHAPT_008999 [Fusarium lateritium]
MPAHIESLPNEILGPILLDLSLVDVARLNQSSKRLNKSLDGYLLSLPTAKSKLMRWGCQNGERWAIDKALALGADINLVQVGPIVSSTICLAARRHQYETIKFLLDSGARLDTSGLHHRQERALRQRLFEPGNPKLLRLCLEKGVTEQIPDLQTRIDEALLSAVKLGLGPEIYQQWMDLGANPTTLRGKPGDTQSAFSMAVLSGSLPETQFLLPQDVNLGVSDASLFQLPRYVYGDLHPWNSVPMLAAARSMVVNGTTDVMDALLDLGGDINLSVPCPMGVFGLSKFDPQPVNPLAIYVLSLNPRADLGAMKLSPAQGVKYLLDKGAKPPKLENPKLPAYSSTPELHPLIRLLWSKHHGIKGLVNDEIFAVFKVLIENGAVKHAIKAFLLPPHQFERPSSPCKICENNKGLLPDDIYRLGKERWGTLLDLMLRDDNFKSSLSEEIDALFFDFVVKIFWTKTRAVWGFPEECVWHISYEYMDESHPTTIQKLIEKGATLNGKSSEADTYTEPLKHGSSKRGTSQVLLKLFKYRSLDRGNYYDNGRGRRIVEYELQDKIQCSLVAMLVKMGAKPLTDTPEPLKDSSVSYQKIRDAFRGEIAEEDKLYWNPRCGFLWDGSWKES